MKAVRWHARQDIRVDEIPDPVPQSDEVLVKVSLSGICGSEVHELLSGPVFIPLDKHPLTGTCAPQTLGHEFGGVIAAKGGMVQGLEVGDLVTINPIVSCGKCPMCARGLPSLCAKLAYYGAIGDGGHAEYARVRASNCLRLPKAAKPEHAAFGEPGGVAYHAVNQGKVQKGCSVAVLGAGPIGQLAVQYARHNGASKVFLTELAPERIRKAQQIGAADGVFNPVECDVVQAILDATGGEGVDVAIECCGGEKTGLLEDTAVQAIQATRPAGTVVLVGTFSAPTPIQLNDIVLMERTVVGSWVWHSHKEYEEAMALIVAGEIKVDPLITRRVRIDEAPEEGIRELALNRDEHVKIMVDFT